MTVLAVSGDIGGQKALIPVLESMAERQIDFRIVDHRGLGNISDKWIKSLITSSNEDKWNEILKKERISSLIFTTSVSDNFPLKLAKSAKNANIAVFSILDNWMNYRKRLEINGESTLLPDIYFVMDKVAFDGAVREGIPESILKIAGQPALADIKRDFDSLCGTAKRKIYKSACIAPDRKFILFISEPAEKDQGEDFTNPLFRGYTEKTVLKRVCKELQRYKDKIYFGILPHPREDSDALLKIWHQNKGELKGGKITAFGRNAVFAADGVCGMTSILLYEAWLVNKPIMSLQPGLIREDLRNLFSGRDDILCLSENREWSGKIDEFMDKVLNVRQCATLRKELFLHESAAEKIVESIITFKTSSKCKSGCRK